MRDAIATTLLPAALPFHATALWLRVRAGMADGPVDGYCAVACAVVCPGFLLVGAYPWAAGSALVAVWCGWAWWNRRRKDRKRLLMAAGYKARVLLAKLLQRARETAQPRPVPRLAPGGAR